MIKRTLLVTASLVAMAALSGIASEVVPRGDDGQGNLDMATQQGTSATGLGEDPIACANTVAAALVVYASYNFYESTLVDGTLEHENDLVASAECVEAVLNPADVTCVETTVDNLSGLTEDEDEDPPTQEEIEAAAGPCLGGPQIEEESLTSSNANENFAKAGNTLTLIFDSTGPITNPKVTFLRDGTQEFAQDVEATPRDGNDDGTEWTASTVALDGDGAITAKVSHDDDPDSHQPVGGVTLDNTPPEATIDLPAGDFIDSTATTSVVYDVSIDETNLDAASSNHEWNNGAGPNSEDVDDGQYTGTIPAQVSGTFSVTLDLIDKAGNSDQIISSIPYRQPGIQASLESSNGNSFAKAGDTVTLTLVSPDDITGLQVDFSVAGDAVDSVTIDDSEPKSVTASFTPAPDGAEGEVTFVAAFTTTTEGPTTLTTTGDGSGVTVDFTPPTMELRFPQIQPDGSLGVPPAGEDEESIVVMATFPDDFDAQESTWTISCSSAGSECDNDASPQPALVSTDEDAGTVTYSIEKDHFGAGTITFSGEAKDMAGNAVTWSTDVLDVVVLAERVTATLTQGTDDVDGASLLIGDGDPNGELAFGITVDYTVFDGGEPRGLGGIFVEFVHGAGDGLQVASDDAVVLITDGSGRVVGLEFSTSASDAFSFTVTNTESDGLATDDELVMSVTAFAQDFAQLGGLLASTSIIADVDGPTIGAHEYPMAGGDGKIDYLEFKANGDVIVAEIADILEVGGSEPAGVVVGFFEGETFVELGSDDLADWVEGDVVTVVLDVANLPSGDQTLVAIASDALGNDGQPLPIDVYIGIRQYIIVTSADETVWVRPGGEADVSFTLEPSDVAQDILRYDLRTVADDGEYALSRFIGGGAFSGLTGNGELQLVRFRDPANDQSLSMDGVQAGRVFGHTASHGTTSEFTLTVLNTAGQAAAFEIVTLGPDGELASFNNPVFTAMIDDLAPSLENVALVEQPDGGHYAAGDGAVLTFTFEAADDDSGLAEAAPILVEVCDDDCTDGPWTIVDDTVLDVTDGSITVPRDTPGTFSYRVVAVDAAGNTAESIPFAVTIVGDAVAEIGVQVSQGIRDLQGDAGILYADMDSAIPGEGYDSSDEIVLRATVLVDGQAEQDIAVELSFGDVLMDTTTDAMGQASWSVDPDEFDFDLQTVTFTVTVAEQSITRDGAQIFISETSDTRDVLWTAFHVDLAGPADVTVGQAFDVDAAVYWLHEVYTETGIDLAGATAAAFSSTVSLDEDVGAQALTEIDVPGSAAPDGQASFSLTRGTAPIIGTSSDVQAGYRSYSAVLEGLPYGMMGHVDSTPHEVLVSGIRLVATFDPMGMAGDDVDIGLDTEWLHATTIDGSDEPRQVDPVLATLSGAVDDTVDIDGAATGTGVFPSGTDLLSLQGTSTGPFDVFGAEAELHGVTVEFPSLPNAMPAPGEDVDALFNVVIDGEPLTPSYQGLSKTLSHSAAGQDAQERTYTGKPLDDQEPFTVTFEESSIPATFTFPDPNGINWNMALQSPDPGQYGLEVELAIAQEGGNDFIAAAAETFHLAYKIYLIEAGETSHGAAVRTATDDTYWFDRHTPTDVSHEFTVKQADWDGTAAQNAVPAADGTRVQVWQSTDDGASWQTYGAPLELASGDGTATFTISRSDSAASDMLFRMAVVEDSEGSLATQDGLGDGTLPYELRFLFTGISLAFTSNGDQFMPVGQAAPIEVIATYDHDGLPIEFLDIAFNDDRPDSTRDLVTDATGLASTLYSFSTPQAITGLIATANAPHDLAPASLPYGGSLRWVELSIGDIVVEKTADGSAWQIVDGEDREYTVAPGEFVRVKVTVVADDGDSTTPVDGGQVRFGSATPSPIDASGSASRSYYRSGVGTTGQMFLDVVGAKLDGVDYGDVEDADHFTILWAS